MRCDLCNEPMQAGQPRMGGKGDGGITGSPFGFERHWDCHTSKFGRPAPAKIAAAIRHSEMKPRRAVLAPKVKSGPYNRSDNAAREFEVLERVSQMGKSRVLIECPFCFATFWAFIWSISGGGKKCHNCGAMHGSFGRAYPIEGNEDLS